MTFQKNNLCFKKIYELQLMLYHPILINNLITSNLEKLVLNAYSFY